MLSNSGPGEGPDSIELPNSLLPRLDTVECVLADANPDKRNCSVNSIHDGYTLRVTCEGARVKVRLYCIDTPELAQPPWGGECRDYLRSLVGYNVILLDHGKDRYGRVLGEVLFQGETAISRWCEMAKPRSIPDIAPWVGITRQNIWLVRAGI
jgi:endonuclease YncB( thermonuclease family)